MVQILPREKNMTILKEMHEASCQSLVLFSSIELWCSGTSLYWGADSLMCCFSGECLTWGFDHLQRSVKMSLSGCLTSNFCSNNNTSLMLFFICSKHLLWCDTGSRYSKENDVSDPYIPFLCLFVKCFWILRNCKC